MYTRERSDGHEDKRKQPDLYAQKNLQHYGASKHGLWVDTATPSTGFTGSLTKCMFNPQAELALRRTRVNRLLMRKRRHSRFGKSLAIHMAIAAMILLSAIVVLFSGAAGASYAYYQAQMPLLNGIADHSLFQTTHIYDRNGKLLYELYDHQINKGRRTYVNYNDISQFLVKATIAAEDHTFWTNSGVDYYGIARAAVSDLQSKGVIEGGSTITQQLIKNQFFQGQPRDLPVKGEEAVLATGLTQQYPKWKIMEMYLNTVYYGDTNYGVEAAAQDYFGLQSTCSQYGCKPVVANLDLAQASLLAGLPQSPTSYNPTLYKEKARTRQQQILQSMLELNMITVQQKEDAQREIQNFNFQPYSQTHHVQAPHFVNYVVDQLEQLLGAQNLENGGYSIYTTLDLDLEKKVEQVVYDHLYKPQMDSYLGYYGPLNRTNNVNDGAAVIMNPATGELLAMDGSASTDASISTPQMQGDYNATLAPRQPGSSFKPFVYAAAFELGWYPAMILPDHKTYYPGGDKAYSPQNYDGSYHTGYPMTARTAIANSFNIPAIDALEFAGIPNVVNMAGRLGLSEVTQRRPSDLGPSMALGAIEVSPLHMTAAYAAFANKGVRVPTTAILKIVDNRGQLRYNFDPAHVQGVQAVREDVAYLMSSMLSDKTARYHEFFPGNPLELNRPAAVKTGTTDSFRDNWTIGYTPHLAVGVWAGNSDNTTMNNVIGITGAGPIWHDIMEYASQYYNYPADNFVQPDDVHKGVVSALTGLLPRPGEPTVSDLFIDGTLPTVQGTIPVYVGPSCTVQPSQHGHHNNQHNQQGNVTCDPNNQNGNGQNGQDNQNGQNNQNNQNGQGNQNGNNGNNDFSVNGLNAFIQPTLPGTLP